MYDAIDDPYIYENSTVLVNKLDLRKQEDLDDFEAEISSARSAEPLPEGHMDFAHYCAVHHHLFQDVYEWAGRPRTVRMSKQGSPFCFPERIHHDDRRPRLGSDPRQATDGSRAHPGRRGGVMSL